MHLFIHSFKYSNHFTLVRVAADPEPLPGTLRVMWEYILDRTTHICMLIHNNLPNSTF